MDFVTEAHRALELLEEYHTKLTSPQDKQLRAAIERVIGIFKSRLFQALLGKSSHSYYFRDGMLISGWLHFIDFNKPENWITFTQENRGKKKNSKTVEKKRIKNNDGRKPFPSSSGLINVAASSRPSVDCSDSSPRTRSIVPDC